MFQTYFSFFETKNIKIFGYAKTNDSFSLMGFFSKNKFLSSTFQQLFLNEYLSQKIFEIWKKLLLITCVH